MWKLNTKNNDTNPQEIQDTKQEPKKTEKTDIPEKTEKKDTPPNYSKSTQEIEKNQTIGQYLKNLRERKHLTIEEVQNETRLKHYLINQIESDDFDAIGDVGFIKIMLFTYCRALGGDEDWLQKKISHQIDKETPPPIKINTAKNVKPIILPNNLIWFICLGVIIALLSTGFYKLYKSGDFSLSGIGNIIAEFFRRPGKQQPTDTEDTENTLPDSTWIKQREMYAQISENEIANELLLTTVVTPQTTEPNPTTTGGDIEIVDIPTPRQTTTNPQPVVNRFYLTDKTDYVGHLLFKDKVSPLNPEI